VLSVLALRLGTAADAASAPAPTPGTVGNRGGAANATKPAAKPDVRPLWAELTPAQRQALAPLEPDWNKLDGNHKTKWLAVGNKYATMNPEQQKRLQENIRDWAKLTPEQHRIARESFARVKKLNPEQKTAQWEQYQQLPEEQKQKLAADAATKKRIANLPNPQNKAKSVEPLKSSKKSTAARSAVPLPASQPAVPTAPPAPSAAAAVTPSTQAPAPTPAPPNTAPSYNK
jgi:hypothetical protein